MININHVIDSGIYDISNDDYHTHHAISRSAIMEFKKSPKHYWYKYLSGKYVRPNPTPALIFGSAAHTFMIEYHAFFERYAIKHEKLPKLKNVGKEAYDTAKSNQKNFIESSKNKYILSQEDFSKLIEMKNEIFENTTLSSLISNAQYEKSIFWIDPDTGIECKCRPDILHDNFVIDYKTCLEASKREFQRACFNSGYYIQMAMIKEGLKHALGTTMEDFIFIAQEKSAPYLTAIYTLDELAIQRGIEEFKDILVKIKKCREENNYSGYEIQNLTLPAYAVIGD